MLEEARGSGFSALPSCSSMMWFFSLMADSSFIGPPSLAVYLVLLLLV